MWSKFSDTAPNAVSIGWQIKWPQRAAFPVTGRAIVGDHFDNITIKDLYRFTTGPIIGTFMQWQVDLVNSDRFNFHMFNFSN
jgi:hypothetical protein